MSQHSACHLNTGSDTQEQKRPLSYDVNCFLYILRGNGCLKIKGRTFPLLQGQCCLIPCGSYASYWSEGEEGWEYVWITFEAQLFEEILRKIAFSAENPICEVTREQADYFINICGRKYDSRSGEYYHTVGLLVQLLSSFVASFPSDAQMAEDGSMRSIIAFIHNNLFRPELTVEYMAKVINMSRTTLYSKFKKEVGCSPSEYIQNKRIGKARYLLRTTKLPVMQIACAVGFDNPLYFSRVFHKIAGSSPSHYRKFVNKMETKEK